MIKVLLVFFIFTSFVFSKPANEKAFELLKNNQQKDVFSFAVMGDNRNGDEVFQSIIKELPKTDVKFAINNGDIVFLGLWWEFKNYLTMIKESKVPIISVIGNHEISFFSGKNNFKKYIGKTNFSFSYANSYFISIDNTKKFKKKQFKWLEKELQKSKKYKHRFVFLHIPLYDPRKGDMKKGHSMKELKTAKQLNDIFDKYNVSMVFASHIHSLYNGYWQKTPFIITGGAGAPKRWDNGFHHFVVVHVNKDKFHIRIVKITS